MFHFMKFPSNKKIVAGVWCVLLITKTQKHIPYLFNIIKLFSCRNKRKRNCRQTSERSSKRSWGFDRWWFTDSYKPNDIHRSARESVRIKWQRRWDIIETGRHLYRLKPQIQPKYINFNNLSSQRQLLQLQSGYCLNDYLCKIGIKDTRLCKCGEVETIDHFIEECCLYEVKREHLKKEIFLKAGINEFSTKLLLAAMPDDPYKEFRDELSNILNQFVESTKRF